MEKRRESNSIARCRLCGIPGNHRIEILDENLRLGHVSPTTLSEKIFQCVAVRVKRSDKSTKICGNCFCKIYDYDRYRESCAAINHEMTSDETAGEDGEHSMGIDTGILSQNASDIFFPVNDVEMDSENVETTEHEEAESVARSAFDDDATLLVGRVASGERGNTTNAFETEKRKKTRSVYDENTALEPSETDPFSAHDGSNSIDGIVSFNGNENASGTKVIDVNDKIVQAHDRVHTGNSAGTRQILKINAITEVTDTRIKCQAPGSCKESFTSWDEMMHHKMFYHPKGSKVTFNCHLCRKQLRNKNELKCHLNSKHTGETSFMCPIRPCLKEFTLKRSLKIHINAIHTKKVSFRCTKCPMRFYYKNLLKMHLANKHGEGNTFACYLCRKQLSTKQMLKLHLNALHTGQTSFMCPIRSCLKKINQADYLKVHLNAVHTKEKVFECETCLQKFYAKGYLLKHMARKH